MKVGIGFKDVTPDHPVMQGGYGTRTHSFDKVHDPIEAVCLWLDYGNRKVCFLNIDVIGVNAETCDAIRDIICNKIVVKREDIVIGAIHSHSAPMIMSTKYYALKTDDEYANTCIEQSANLAIEVSSKCVDATARISKFEIDGFYSNRNDINKLGDKWFYLLEFLHEGETIAAYANISCHSTVLGPDNYECSGDLVGNLRRKLMEMLHFPILLTVGNSGDMSNRQYRQGNDFKELDRVVEGIAKQVVDKRDSSIVTLEPFENISYSYPIHYTMDQSEVKRRLDAYEEKLKTETDYDAIKLIKAGIAAFKRKQNYDLVDFSIDCRILNLGDVQIIVVPGELVAKFGLELKNASHAKVCIVQGYSNDSIGYIVEKEEYGKAHESNASLIPVGDPEKMIQEISQQI